MFSGFLRGLFFVLHCYTFLVDRYVPPHLRKNPQQGRATRTAPQGIPGSGRSSVSSVSSPQPSPTQHSAPVELDSNLSAGNVLLFPFQVLFQFVTRVTTKGYAVVCCSQTRCTGLILSPRWYKRVIVVKHIRLSESG